MPNLLTVAMVETILALHQRGWSQRRIAQELGIDRETVARYLKRHAGDPKPAIAPIGSELLEADSKPANAPIGSEPVEADPKPAIAPIGSEPLERGGRHSDCEPFRDTIRAKLERDLSAQRIFQDLVAEHGFTGSYYSVHRVPFSCRRTRRRGPPYAGNPLPAAYREFMLKFGHYAGPLFVGSDYSLIGENKARFREVANQLIGKSKSGHSLESSHFVFLLHQGYQFLYFDCNCGDNPPVFRFRENMNEPVLQSASLTEFLLRCITNHERILSRMATPD